jgi:CheY-like chemotaxis protein
MTAILLVEDNPNDVELTLHAFERNNLGNAVHVARDGQEALDYLFAAGPYANREARVQPQVILLDINMPKVNGIDVLTRIRGDQRTHLLPVVMLTSSA